MEERVELSPKQIGLLHRMWLNVETTLNRIYRYNPLYHLHSLGVFLIWVALFSGIYLFIFYKINPEGAYQSVKYLTEDQWWLGGIMRSIHRYGSDLLVIVMLLHLVKTFVTSRHGGWRKLAWVSGVFILWVVWICGIFGYWLVWDRKAQLIAVLSAEMLERIPIFGQPLSISFSGAGSLDAIFFYILFIMHFALTVFLFILLWVHVSRIASAKINPPLKVGLATLGLLLLYSLLFPAGLEPAADLKVLPAPVEIDWFFLFLYPPMKYISVPLMWLIIVGATVLLALVPWLFPTKKELTASVILKNCTGCEQCVFDCPYEAIYMQQRTDGKPFNLEAVVSPKKCAGCAICVGACDFDAINMQGFTEKEFKEEIRALSQELAEAKEGPTLLVFACRWGVDVSRHMDGINAKVLTVPCAGMVQPPMAELALNAGVDGVLISACAENDCHYREGDELLKQRFGGIRRPTFKTPVDKGRIKILFLAQTQQDEFVKKLKGFVEELRKRHSTT